METNKGVPEPVPAPGLSDAEVEVVCLTAVVEIIDSIVNHEVFDILGQDPNSQISFPRRIHQQFFNIVLVDFLSKTDKNGLVPVDTYLKHLRRIAVSPAFDHGHSICPLKTATADYVTWLEHEPEIPIWLPSLNQEATIKLPRWESLKRCGNISKHNFLKAWGLAKDLKGALSSSGVHVTLEDALMALPDFHARFHTDILNYHSSTIAEFLNNIRWGIHEYLQPQLQRSIVRDEHDYRKYHYAFPPDVAAGFAKACYEVLMNKVRRPPFVQRFQVSSFLKLRY